uniref:Uncharacterized protein n=1 Tax=Lepeophtheirus salmonis TaxID=72036 RepID=A0A0K2U514_LEPSM
MNIVTSPTPAGPLQNYSTAVTSFPTPNPVPQSPTPRVESLDLLERIRFIKNMMITVQDTGESPSGVGEKTHKRHHANPTQMISSGVDLDSLIPELLDVVAASMASGDKKKRKSLMANLTLQTWVNKWVHTRVKGFLSPLPLNTKRCS